ncbi:inositol monophosphatase [Pseudarthrobacter sulfonivorans]|uniref:Inositol-1-monophosphatase n=1 Tax=Pseudarthrobacter sulfonivorans TaxID=121292 RepID=A0A0U3Q494_9MICC|nr:inositol monophosphatase family protein [Pseudarthrobacter sulfonivorans]ALV40042.1 inositol monophosphatase [Pseudarthrobacter sulfonivorans]
MSGRLDPAGGENPHHNELRSLAERVAGDAGANALKLRRAGVSLLGSKSSPEDVVTAADRETETLIRQLIQEARPDDAFLGEEGGSSSGSSGLTWIVDPIDGTVNYLYDIPAWAVSIAVVEGDPDPGTWRLLAGAILVPSLGEIYSAALGGGATLNGKPIKALEAPNLSLSLVATGFTYSSERRTGQTAILNGLISSVRDIRRSGSAALDLCSVASGRVNAYYESYVNPWDHAAGSIIAREAGAVVGGFDGNSEGYDLLIAAPPATYARLEEALKPLYGDASIL